MEQEFRVKKRKYIALPDRYKKQIVQEFGVSSESVRLALSFRTEGEQPEKIRERAMQMGAFIAYKAV